MKAMLATLSLYSRIGGEQRFNARIARCLGELEPGAATVLALWDSPEHRSHAPGEVRFIGCRESKVAMVKEFTLALVRERPEVILYGHIVLLPLVLLAKLLRPGARNLLFAYGVDAWGGDQIPARRWRRILLSSFFDTVVTISALTRRRMSNAYRLADSRFEILPCAIDAGNQGQAPRTRGSAQILTVSRLRDRYKGEARVIEAMPRVLVAFPEAIYEIVGDGPIAPELRELAAKLGVADHVRFRGALGEEELDAAYRAAAVFALPSKGEGFGIVYLEAWLRGVPVIAGRGDAGGELVIDGFDGLTVDPEDPNQIADSIVSVLSDAARARVMGENGYSTVLRLYTHNAFRSRFAEILTAGHGSMYTTLDAAV